MVTSINGSSIDEIFGYPDNLKFRSCMTLFAHATSEDNVFEDALTKYFGGKPDSATLKLLKRAK